jgi:hydrogenase expression/formation protein HypD
LPRLYHPGRRHRHRHQARDQPGTTPAGQGSLFEARAKGADVRIVYGPRDAVKLAQDNPSRVTVFFSVGFETTAAPVASLLKGQLSPNFLVYFCHRYVPAAVEVLASDPETAVNGYLLPGHACVITGTRAYDYLPRRLHKPAAAAGFEPVDILAGLLSILRQVRQGNPVVANCYPRAVSAEGNLKAQAALDEVFVRTDAAWRGIGVLPGTGFELREKYRRYDALARLGLSEESAEDILPGCSCHLIMTGRREPRECGLFGKACAPDHPRGPCMVGAEGTCRAHYLFPEDEDV